MTHLDKTLKEFDEEFGEETGQICSAHNGTVQEDLKDFLIQSHIKAYELLIERLHKKNILLIHQMETEKMFKLDRSVEFKEHTFIEEEIEYLKTLIKEAKEK